MKSVTLFIKHVMWLDYDNKKEVIEKQAKDLIMKDCVCPICGAFDVNIDRSGDLIACRHRPNMTESHPAKFRISTRTTSEKKWSSEKGNQRI